MIHQLICQRLYSKNVPSFKHILDVMGKGHSWSTVGGWRVSAFPIHVELSWNLCLLLLILLTKSDRNMTLLYVYYGYWYVMSHGLNSLKSKSDILSQEMYYWYSSASDSTLRMSFIHHIWGLLRFGHIILLQLVVWGIINAQIHYKC